MKAKTHKCFNTEMIHGKNFHMNTIVLELDNGIVFTCEEKEFNHSVNDPLELIVWLPNENRWVRTYKKDQISSIMWRCYKKHKEKYDKINYENMMKHDRRHKGGGGGTRIFNGSITDYECRKDPFHDFRQCWN